MFSDTPEIGGKSMSKHPVPLDIGEMIRLSVEKARPRFLKLFEVEQQQEPTTTSVTPASSVTSVTANLNKDSWPDDATMVFPMQALPPAVREMVQAAVAALNTSETLTAVSALATVSSSLGKGIALQSGPERVTRGNLYIIASARSGTGKTEAFRPIIEPLLAEERRFIESWGAIHRDDDNQRPGADRTWPQWVCEDVTAEKLAQVLQSNGETVASLSSDAGAVLSNLLGRYAKRGRTDDALYLKAYSGERCLVDRMKRTIRLESPCLSLFWLLQPEKLKTLYRERQLVDSGFLARVMPVQTRARIAKIREDAPPIPIECREAWSRLISALCGRFHDADQPVVVQATKGARKALNEHYNSLVDRRESDLADIDEFAARWNEWAWRLTVVLHCAAHGSSAADRSVETQTAESAVTLADWFARQQLFILEEVRAQKRSEIERRVYELLEGEAGGVTVRHVQRARIAESAAEAQALLNQMERDEKLNSSVRIPAGGGHPMRIFKRNNRDRPDVRDTRDSRG